MLFVALISASVLTAVILKTLQLSFKLSLRGLRSESDGTSKLYLSLLLNTAVKFKRNEWHSSLRSQK